jgi:hypothetical protein
LPNPLEFQYTNLTLEQLTHYISLILNKIFDNAYAEQIKEYNSKINLFRTHNPFDAILETKITTKDDCEIVKFHISKELASIQVVSTSHEYIHGLLSKCNTHRFNSVYSNYHYKELLSILIEYISVYELSKLLKQDILIDQHNIIRLSTDKDHILASEENKAFMYTPLVKQLPKTFINNYKRCIAYDEHNSFGYIISDIYATRLFELYKDNPKTILTIFKSIIDGQKNIKDLLDYYDISIRNQDTYLCFNKRIDNIPKL